ncbi:hypothetical protein EK904_006852 [Melospiza melodia maxima]|nr:hypothetical protein EK904_006852 [Melospiza melodia maxima]
MMDHSLQTISYIADIGSLVVLMARRKLPRRSEAAEEKRLYKMICHVFHSPDVSEAAHGSLAWVGGPGDPSPIQCNNWVFWAGAAAETPLSPLGRGRSPA